VSENIDKILTSSKHTGGLKKPICCYSINRPTPEVVTDVGQWAYTTDTIDASNNHREVRTPPGGVVIFSWTRNSERESKSNSEL